MLRMILISHILCLSTVHLIGAVDYDYYFRALRSKKSCNNMTEKINCQIKCGTDNGMCIGNDCYCLTVSTFNKDGIKAVPYDHKNVGASQETPEYLDESLLYNKPILRHHIAHFCPNLDLARSCIRTCMAEGKPAFCGKDHVCYCGHRYSNKDINRAVDVASVYAQFRDMYDKYFGPNYKPII